MKHIFCLTNVFDDQLIKPISKLESESKIFNKNQNTYIKKASTCLKIESVIEPVVEQVVNKLCTSSGTGTEHVIGIFYKHNINNTNISNIENLQTSEKIFQNKKNNFLENETENSKEKKLRQKKKGFNKPNLEKVKKNFQQNDFSDFEIEKKKLNLIVYLKNYRFHFDNSFLQEAVFIMLEDLVGEMAVKKHISLVQLAQLSNNPRNLIRLYELQEYIERLSIINRKNNFNL